ncbi:envelope stress response membrane protein PspB [Porticoccus sp. W117]|uniref:envelope stress response membrane protein PspB n=1 Tax=Porticoccus sp. W117 TaxID=3054777 RepID=UPI002593BBC9|nr:envelope stress response membrane protein PspB [Porticoccus sp. W117]MDM3870759.1 envelope stress response membrane protein PspB [Porticoccus sp. W117]
MQSSHLFVLALVFMVVVVPMLISSRNRHTKSMESSKGASMDSQDRVVVEEMLETIDTLVDRIEVLESILDDTHPNWRKVKKRSAGE